MNTLTKEQRDQLETLLIEDVVQSAAYDSGYALNFIGDVMANGYTPLSEYAEKDLLQWHRDAFDCDFQTKPET